MDQLAHQAAGEAQCNALRIGMLDLLRVGESLARRVEGLSGAAQNEQSQGQPAQRRYARIMAVEKGGRRVQLGIVEPDDRLQFVRGGQRLPHAEHA